jgi:hypothetical protein
MTPEFPPGFVVRMEAQKAASDNGFRLEKEIASGWMRFGSTTVHGEIWIGGGSPHGPWFLSVSHPGVAAELGASTPDVDGPGVGHFIFSTLGELHRAVKRAYRLGVSLPDAPLNEFQKNTQQMPRTTDVERIVVRRIGQDIFRKALLAYWNGRCPMTGITDPALLKASHIVPWAECESDAQRLDVHNGLLLSALWDAAFDAGRVSFADNGDVIVHPSLGQLDRKVLLEGSPARLTGLTTKHLSNLAQHRAHILSDDTKATVV